MASPQKAGVGGTERPERRGNERGPHPSPGSPSPPRDGVAQGRNASGGAAARGLRTSRPRLAGSAAHSRLTGRGHQQRRRAAARRPRITAPAARRRRYKYGTPQRAGRISGVEPGFRDPDGAWRPARKPGVPPGREAVCRGAAIKRRTLSGRIAIRQCASSAPHRQGQRPLTRASPIVTARPRPVPGLGGEGLARAIERRSRGQPPARGAAFRKINHHNRARLPAYTPSKEPEFPAAIRWRETLPPALSARLLAPRLRQPWRRLLGGEAGDPRCFT